MTTGMSQYNINRNFARYSSGFSSVPVSKPEGEADEPWFESQATPAMCLLHYSYSYRSL